MWLTKARSTMMSDVMKPVKFTNLQDYQKITEVLYGDVRYSALTYYLQEYCLSTRMEPNYHLI